MTRFDHLNKGKGKSSLPITSNEEERLENDHGFQGPAPTDRIQINKNKIKKNQGNKTKKSLLKQ